MDPSLQPKADEAPPIRIPFARTRLTDACMAPLDVLENRFYNRCIFTFNRVDWFHVTVLMRAFAEIRRLNCLLEGREVELRSAQRAMQVMSVMVHNNPPPMLLTPNVPEQQIPGSPLSLATEASVHPVTVEPSGRTTRKRPSLQEKEAAPSAATSKRLKKKA
jgi:hypothetical protein